MSVMKAAVIRAVSGLVAVAFVLFLVVKDSTACSIGSIEYQKTAPEFTVSVAHKNKPIAGVSVRVYTPGDQNIPVVTVQTGDDGTAQIRNLASGKYLLIADRFEITAARVWLDVDPAASGAKRNFEFEWAEYAIIARRISGTLSAFVPANTGNKIWDITHPVKAFSPNVSLTLENGLTGNKYQGTTDQTGTFEFGGVPAGVYVMHIAGGMKLMGQVAEITDLPVELDPTAERVSLPLLLKDTGCYSISYQLEEAKNN